MNTQKLINLLEDSTPEGWTDDQTNEHQLSRIVDALKENDLERAKEELDELAGKECGGTYSDPDFCKAIRQAQQEVSLKYYADKSPWQCSYTQED